MKSLTNWTFQLSPLPSQTPDWSSSVERWYQLDGPSLLLCHGYWTHREKLQKTPDLIILNSPQTSFLTDQAFCQTLSPSKFVHTLPNVRSSALLQLMNWRGPVLSFVDEKEKILKYAEDLLHTAKINRIWVLHIEETPVLKVDWYVHENTAH